jgi:hypothetical protein
MALEQQREWFTETTNDLVLRDEWASRQLNLRERGHSFDGVLLRHFPHALS